MPSKAMHRFIFSISCWVHILLPWNGKAEDVIPSPASTYTLTWTGYNGDPLKNGFDKIEFFLDGKSIGGHHDAFSLFEGMSWKAGSTFRIVFPDNTNFDAEHYNPPYLGSSLPTTLVSSGIKLEFYHKGQKCDIRTYWWDSKEMDFSSWEDKEFFLDGVSLGKGLDAQKKLGEIKWGYRPTLLVLLFEGREHPYRTTQLGIRPPMAEDHGREVERKLYEQKVRHEFYSGTPKKAVEK